MRRSVPYSDFPTIKVLPTSSSSLWKQWLDEFILLVFCFTIIDDNTSSKRTSSAERERKERRIEQWKSGKKRPIDGEEKREMLAMISYYDAMIMNDNDGSNWWSISFVTLFRNWVLVKLIRSCHGIDCALIASWLGWKVNWGIEVP